MSLQAVMTAETADMGSHVQQSRRIHMHDKRLCLMFISISQLVSV
jgi:hypothetical protein